MTAGTKEHADLLVELVDALVALGLDAHADDDALTVDGARHEPLLIARAHPTPADLTALATATHPDVPRSDVSGATGTEVSRPAVVMADRISDAGREVLRDAGWGWLDRRGDVRVWTPGLRLEAPIPGTPPTRGTTGNLWTTVGLEIALHALVHPEDPVTARRLAPAIGRSVGATHELISRFTATGLVGPRTHRPLMPDLFWETAANWPDSEWTPLSVPVHDAAERVEANDLVRVDERAATLGGARIAAAGELPARCYVRSAAGMRRLRGLVDRDRTTRCWVRRAPIEWIPLNEEHPPDAGHPWTVGHPMLCAVRLAADPARGREIVEDWGIVAADA